MVKIEKEKTIQELRQQIDDAIHANPAFSTKPGMYHGIRTRVITANPELDKQEELFIFFSPNCGLMDEYGGFKTVEEIAKLHHLGINTAVMNLEMLTQHFPSLDTTGLPSSPYFDIAIVNPRVTADDMQTLRQRQLALSVFQLSSLGFE